MPVGLQFMFVNLCRDFYLKGDNLFHGRTLVFFSIHRCYHSFNFFEWQILTGGPSVLS